MTNERFQELITKEASNADYLAALTGGHYEIVLILSPDVIRHGAVRDFDRSTSYDERSREFRQRFSYRGYRILELGRGVPDESAFPAVVSRQNLAPELEDGYVIFDPDNGNLYISDHRNGKQIVTNTGLWAHDPVACQIDPATEAASMGVTADDTLRVVRPDGTTITWAGPSLSDVTIPDDEINTVGPADIGTESAYIPYDYEPVRLNVTDGSAWSVEPSYSQATTLTWNYTDTSGTIYYGHPYMPKTQEDEELDPGDTAEMDAFLETFRRK